eukprot:COSAG06_NODE_21562_length_753_cov_0.686544_1_plen_141_part_01
MAGTRRPRTQLGAAAACAVWIGITAAVTVPLPRFSWDTLPVVLHSQNTTCGDWNAAAAARAAAAASSGGSVNLSQKQGGKMVIRTGVTSGGPVKQQPPPRQRVARITIDTSGENADGTGRVKLQIALVVPMSKKEAKNAAW